jgi:hypothetical protein
MYRVQPAGIEAELDRSPPDAHRQELRASHHPMLSCGQARDRPVPRMSATTTPIDPGPRRTFCIDAMLN